MSDDGVIIYAQGALSMSVCVPKDWLRDKVIEEVNRKSLCGTTNGWMISDDKTFKGGQPMPCPCDKFPDARLHYFIEC